MCLEDGWGMWQEGVGVMIIAPANNPGACSATAREPGLAVLPVEDECAEILRGEHHTTVSE